MMLLQRQENRIMIDNGLTMPILLREKGTLTLNTLTQVLTFGSGSLLKLCRNTTWSRSNFNFMSVRVGRTADQCVALSQNCRPKLT